MEGIDPEHPSYYCVLTVADVQGELCIYCVLTVADVQGELCIY
jgi:hypothetical protein